MSELVAIPDVPRTYPHDTFATLFVASINNHKETLDILQTKRLGDATPHHLVPALILKDPLVHSAVAGLLGENAVPDVCRHVHVNAHPKDGPWHRDDYDGEPWPEGVDFAILFYFPQATPPEMGGTSVWIIGQEIIGAGPAGTLLLARGNVLHRARANTTGRTRYMLKYLFRALPDVPAARAGGVEA